MKFNTDNINKPNDIEAFDYEESSGQIFRDDISEGTGTLIHPRLFLTAGHCVLPDYGEYTLNSNGTETFTSNDEIHYEKMTKKELAELTLTYNPEIREKDVDWSVQDTTQDLSIKFYTKEFGEISVKGKVMCGEYTKGHESDFALIELEESVSGVNIPQLSKSLERDIAFIFHYPHGEERKSSIVDIQRHDSDLEILQLTYKTEARNQSSGSGLISKSGKLFCIHTNREMVYSELKEGYEKEQRLEFGVEEDAELTIEEEQQKILDLEKEFDESSNKYLLGMPVRDIILSNSRASSLFKDVLKTYGVEIAPSYSIGTAIGVKAQTNTSQSHK